MGTRQAGEGGVARVANGFGQDAPYIAPDAFSEGFGEDIHQALDVDRWSTGEDLGEVYGRIDAEVREAVHQEERHLGNIRSVGLFPKLASYPGAPKCAGVYRAQRSDLEKVHRGLLFTGGVEAADGTLLSYDSLPLTIFQVGVSLVSYQGHQGVWSHRLFRRDLRVTGDDPTEELIELLSRRESRDGLNRIGRRDHLARLARRGILSYAERAILLRRSEAPWRMGHGSPAPFELLTGPAAWI